MIVTNSVNNDILINSNSQDTLYCYEAALSM